MRMYDFALDVERAGRDFYRGMAEHAEDPGLRRIFAMMADEERQMLRRMSALRKRAEERGAGDAEMFSPEDNVYRRLRPEQLRATIHSDVDAYHLITELVDEVCRVYASRSEALNDPALRSELGEILQREREELEEMLSLYDFANAPNESLAWGEFSNRGEFPRFGHESESDREKIH